MKTLRDLFRINTRGLEYVNIRVYIYDSGRYSISKVWSDTGYDISFETGNSMNPYEFLTTINMSDIAEVYCRNGNINLDEKLIIYIDDETVTVEDIKFEFDNSLIYLI